MSESDTYTSLTFDNLTLTLQNENKPMPYETQTALSISRIPALSNRKCDVARHNPKKGQRHRFEQSA